MLRGNKINQRLPFPPLENTLLCSWDKPKEKLLFWKPLQLSWSFDLDSHVCEVIRLLETLHIISWILSSLNSIPTHLFQSSHVQDNTSIKSQEITNLLKVALLHYGGKSSGNLRRKKILFVFCVRKDKINILSKDKTITAQKKVPVSDTDQEGELWREALGLWQSLL